MGVASGGTHRLHYGFAVLPLLKSSYARPAPNTSATGKVPLLSHAPIPLSSLPTLLFHPAGAIMKHMPWRDFFALVVSIGVVGLGLGATMPLTALTLHQRGVGTDIIGMITAVSTDEWAASFSQRTSRFHVVTAARAAAARRS